MKVVWDGSRNGDGRGVNRLDGYLCEGEILAHHHIQGWWWFKVVDSRRVVGLWRGEVCNFAEPLTGIEPASSGFRDRLLRRLSYKGKRRLLTLLSVILLVWDVLGWFFHLFSRQSW